MKQLLICAALCAGLGVASQANAASSQGSAVLGNLSCQVASGWGFVFGSSRAVNCTFEGVGGRAERYTGKITKYGVDIGYKSANVMVWTVLAPTNTTKPGVLAGQYGGATASATVGVGVGANALLGGFNHSITLQPLSIEGSTGLNVAAGVAGLTLTSVKK
jgi:hypothetical protein